MSSGREVAAELEVRGDALGGEAAAEQMWRLVARAEQCEQRRHLSNFKVKASGLCGVLNV